MSIHLIRDRLAATLTSFEHCFPSIIPYIWGILSACFVAMTNFFVKKLSKDISTSQILFFRSLELTLFTYCFMRLQSMQFHYKSAMINRLLIARALAGTIGVALAFYGLTLLPLSDATVIMQVYPVITGILATLLLGEKYERSQLSAALVCLMGVLMIAQPPFLFGERKSASPETDQNRMIGTVILLMGGLSGSVVEVLIKKVGSKTNMGINTLVFGITAMLISCFLSIRNGFIAIQWHHIPLLFWVGLFSFLGQVLKNRAFMLGNAGRVSNTSYFGIVISYFIDIVIMGNNVNTWSLLGGLCILSCMFIYIFQLYVKERRALVDEKGHQMTLLKV